MALTDSWKYALLLLTYLYPQEKIFMEKQYAIHEQKRS